MNNYACFTISWSTLKGLVSCEKLWLARVTAADEVILGFKNEEGNVIEDVHQQAEISCYYYRNLEPTYYYITILGAYLYQLFFARLADNTKSEALVVKSLKAQLKAEPELASGMVALVKRSIEGSSFVSLSSARKRECRIYQKLTALYLAMCIPQPKTFFLHFGQSSCFDNLLRAWNGVAKDIADFLGVEITQLEHISNEKIKAFKSQPYTCVSAGCDELSLKYHITRILKRSF